MYVACDWNGKRNFIANVNGLKIQMDAVDLFDEKDSVPKQLILAAFCERTGLDILKILEERKQQVEKFKIEADALVSNTNPPELKEIKLRYLLDGYCDADKVSEAVGASQVHYRAVSNRMADGLPIAYNVTLNGREILKGKQGVGLRV